jgi:hypothetical protein
VSSYLRVWFLYEDKKDVNSEKREDIYIYMFNFLSFMFRKITNLL